MSSDVYEGSAVKIFHDQMPLSRQLEAETGNGNAFTSRCGRSGVTWRNVRPKAERVAGIPTKFTLQLLRLKAS